MNGHAQSEKNQLTTEYSANQIFPNNPLTFLSSTIDSSTTFCSDSFKPSLLPPNLGLLPFFPNFRFVRQANLLHRELSSHPLGTSLMFFQKLTPRLSSPTLPRRASRPTCLLGFIIPAFKDPHAFAFATFLFLHSPLFLHLPSVFKHAQTSIPFPLLGTHQLSSTLRRQTPPHFLTFHSLSSLQLFLTGRSPHTAAAMSSCLIHILLLCLQHQTTLPESSLRAHPDPLHP